MIDYDAVADHLRQYGCNAEQIDHAIAALQNAIGKRVYLICPVRHATERTTELMKQWTEWLEALGAKVHWPQRDTPQEDAVGVRICEVNRSAVQSADVIHVWFDPDSRGSLFDFGMVWAMRKPVWAINLPPSTPNKSFANVLRYACLETQWRASRKL